MTATEKKEGVLEANARTEFGKGAARALRREGKVPAIIYTKDAMPLNIAIKSKDVTKEYHRGRFRSRVIDIKLDGQTLRALPKEMQFDPVSDTIEHVDFLKVEADSILRVQVPVSFKNMEKCIGIKRGGVLNVVRHEIELLCKPDAIPSTIEIDLQKVDIAESIHIEDIKLPADVQPSIDRNFTIATIAGRRKDESSTTETTDTAAPEAEGAGDTAEGEAK